MGRGGIRPSVRLLLHTVGHPGPTATTALRCGPGPGRDASPHWSVASAVTPAHPLTADSDGEGEVCPAHQRRSAPPRPTCYGRGRPRPRSRLGRPRPQCAEGCAAGRRRRRRCASPRAPAAGRRRARTGRGPGTARLGRPTARRRPARPAASTTSDRVRRRLKLIAAAGPCLCRHRGPGIGSAAYRLERRHRAAGSDAGGHGRSSRRRRRMRRRRRRGSCQPPAAVLTAARLAVPLPPPTSPHDRATPLLPPPAGDGAPGLPVATRRPSRRPLTRRELPRAAGSSECARGGRCFSGGVVYLCLRLGPRLSLSRSLSLSL